MNKIGRWILFNLPLHIERYVKTYKGHNQGQKEV